MLFRLDFQSAVPIYRQIREVIVGLPDIVFAPEDIEESIRSVEEKARDPEELEPLLPGELYALALQAIHDEPNADDRAIARVIGDVWLSNLVAWVTRRASVSDVAARLELTVHLLLDNVSERPAASAR